MSDEHQVNTRETSGEHQVKFKGFSGEVQNILISVREGTFKGQGKVR